MFIDLCWNILRMVDKQLIAMSIINRAKNIINAQKCHTYFLGWNVLSIPSIFIGFFFGKTGVILRKQDIICTFFTIFFFLSWIIFFIYLMHFILYLLDSLKLWIMDCFFFYKWIYKCCFDQDDKQNELKSFKFSTSNFSIDLLSWMKISGL